MRYYDVAGHDRPLFLSEEHAELLGAKEHRLPSARPALNASKGEWVDYAVAQGANMEAAEAATRASLIEAYGS